MTTQQQFSEIERAANTILSQQSASHPLLQAWIEAVANDPNETRFLDQFPQDERTIEHARESGFATENLEDAINRYEAQAYRVRARSRWLDRAMDEAIRAFASQIVMYRREGRPVGDVHRSLGYGIGVTTSLAAAVAEFVRRVQENYAEEVGMVRDGDDLGPELPEPEPEPEARG